MLPVATQRSFALPTAATASRLSRGTSHRPAWTRARPAGQHVAGDSRSSGGPREGPGHDSDHELRHPGYLSRLSRHSAHRHLRGVAGMYRGKPLAPAEHAVHFAA